MEHLDQDRPTRARVAGLATAFTAYQPVRATLRAPFAPMFAPRVTAAWGVVVALSPREGEEPSRVRRRGGGRRARASVDDYCEWLFFHRLATMFGSNLIWFIITTGHATCLSGSVLDPRSAHMRPAPLALGVWIARPSRAGSKLWCPRSLSRGTCDRRCGRDQRRSQVATRYLGVAIDPYRCGWVLYRPGTASFISHRFDACRHRGILPTRSCRLPLPKTKTARHSLGGCRGRPRRP